MGTRECACQSGQENASEMKRWSSPSVPTAIKFGTGYLLLKLAPVVDAPGRDLEVLDFVPEVGHVLRRERIV
jgi:hypothetical protein